MGTFVWEPWRGHFRLGSSLWELRFRTTICGFRRGNFVWELSFGDRRLDKDEDGDEDGDSP